MNLMMNIKMKLKISWIICLIDMKKKTAIITLITFYLTLFGEQTTLIYPPFKHNMGFNRANSSIAKMVLGRKVKFHRTEGLVALKLLSEDDPESREDDAVLTMFGINNHQLVYNVSTRAVKTYGEKGIGSDPNLLFYPKDVAADKYGNVYISDTYNYRILKLHYNGLEDSLEFIASFGEFGIDSYSVNLPSMIDIDHSGNLYISDTGNNRILILDSSLTPIKIIKNISSPTGITVVDPERGWTSYKDKPFIVIVSDRSKLIKCSMRGETLAEQFSHNVTYFSNADFNAIDYDYNGNLWITDTVNSVIHKFDSNLKYITSFGREGFGKGEFFKPNGISIFRKFGQVFIGEESGFQYYWVGVDGWLEGISPADVNDSTPAITISIYTTEQSRVTMEIKKDGQKIRKLTKYLRQNVGMNHIIWDLEDDKGNRICENGTYDITITLEALYSSRGFFKKKIEGSFEKH